MDTNCIFPDDLVEEILSRLPIKDLLRVRCVSKRWCALIDDVSFIRKHYQVQYSFRRLDDNMTYLAEHLYYPDFQNYEYHLLSMQQGDAFTVDLTAELKRDSNAVHPHGAEQYSIQCLGCVNGILCFTCISRKTRKTNDSFLALWNPATREFKTLAYPNDPGLIHCLQFKIDGFGFDQSLSDFKILGGYFIRRGLDLLEHSSYQVIYSLKSNSWKWISSPPAHICGLPMACFDSYLNGVCYWETDLYQESGRPLSFVIVSFNFAAEDFKVSDPPHDALSLMLESAPYHKTTALYKERLALAMSFKVQDEALYNIHIWVATQLDDCGVPLSWQHLFTVRPTPAKFGLSVDTILMNGDLLLLSVYGDGNEDFEMYLYNHSIGEFKKFGFWWTALFRYVESLFPLTKRLASSKHRGTYLVGQTDRKICGRRKK